MTIAPLRQLGKLPHRPDPRRLQLGAYLTNPQPTTSNWAPAVKVPWNVYDNDTIGDCAIAAPCHAEMCWTANAQTLYAPTDRECVAAYSAVSGYNPAAVDPATGQNPTDVGCVISDVLKYWRDIGIAGRKIGDYIETAPADFATLSTAIDLFGGVDLGVELPLAAQDMTDGVWTAPPAAAAARKQPWWDTLADEIKDWIERTTSTSQPPAVLAGPWAYGSWGGHSVWAVAADATDRSITVISWGQSYRVERGFRLAYMSEAWAIISPEWLKPDAVAPSGLNLAQLQADLVKL